jgi:hypothetical protein
MSSNEVINIVTLIRALKVLFSACAICRNC